MNDPNLIARISFFVEDLSMKWLSLAVALVLSAFLITGSMGCSKGGSSPTGPGGSKLSVKAPGNTSINQGESADVEVSITREKMSDPVTVEFTDLPKGVTVEGEKTIGKDHDKGKFPLKAAADAPPVDNHTVKVGGKGGTLEATDSFKVTVKKKG